MDTRNVDAFVEKVTEFLDSPAPVLMDQMPTPGKCLQFTEKQVKGACKRPFLSINSKVEERTTALESRLSERLSKELQIIKRYYKQRQVDLKAEITADGARAADATKSAQYRRQKGSDVPKHQEELNQIKQEVKSKQTELEENYAVTAEYDIVGPRQSMSQPISTINALFPQTTVPPNYSCFTTFLPTVS